MPPHPRKTGKRRCHQAKYNPSFASRRAFTLDQHQQFNEGKSRRAAAVFPRLRLPVPNLVARPLIQCMTVHRILLSGYRPHQGILNTGTRYPGRFILQFFIFGCIHPHPSVNAKIPICYLSLYINVPLTEVPLFIRTGRYRWRQNDLPLNKIPIPERFRLKNEFKLPGGSSVCDQPAPGQWHPGQRIQT